MYMFYKWMIFSYILFWVVKQSKQKEKSLCLWTLSKQVNNLPQKSGKDHIIMSISFFVKFVLTR